MSKSKNVDSITPATVLKGKEQYRSQETVITDNAPLLSIIDPEVANISAEPVVSPKTKKKFSFFKKAKTPSEIVAERPKKEAKSKPEKAAKVAKPKREKKLKISIGSILRKKATENTAENTAESTLPAKKRSFKKPLAWTAVVAIFLALGVAGAAYAHQSFYKDKIFPGVTVWGTEVGGKNVTELQEVISAKVKNYRVTVKGPDQDYTANAEDLGLAFNNENMITTAFSLGRTGAWYDEYLTRVRLAVGLINFEPLHNLIASDDLVIKPSYNVNQQVLDAYLTKVSNNINIQAQDSQIVVSGRTTNLKPAIYGRKVNYDNLKQGVLASISKLESKKIEVVTVTIKPGVIDTAAEEVMLQAQNVMSRTVVLTYQGQEYRPNQETIGSWISFTKNANDSKYTLVIDKAKMSSYMSFLQSKINIKPTPKIVKVENGVKQTEVQAGVNGLAVDTNTLTSQIATNLPVQSNVRLSIPTYVDVFKTQYQNVVVADWDKYIDINLSTQTMIACEKGGVNCREWKITSGDDSHKTPTGTFLVRGRSAHFYMTGGSVSDGTYYKLWVDYATWFTPQGHAIHDAYWRTRFGGQDYHYNGSHGCINSPDDASVYIYNWAPVGTPVIVHY